MFCAFTSIDFSAYSDALMLDDKIDFFTHWNILGIWIAHILGDVIKLISLTVPEDGVRNMSVQLTNTWHLISIETYLWADKTGYLPDLESVQNPVWEQKSVFIPMLQTENFTEGDFKNATGKKMLLNSETTIFSQILWNPNIKTEETDVECGFS